MNTHTRGQNFALETILALKISLNFQITKRTCEMYTVRYMYFCKNCPKKNRFWIQTAFFNSLQEWLRTKAEFQRWEHSCKVKYYMAAGPHDMICTDCMIAWFIFVCLHGGICACLHAPMHICVSACLHVCMFACLHVGMFAWLNTSCMFTWLRDCMSWVQWLHKLHFIANNHVMLLVDKV